MATAPTSTFAAPLSNQPPRTVHALVNEETRAPPPVRLYPSQHRVSMTRYATSTDPRGYIPVFEYPLNGQYIMIDCETGMVHFTGIWKALGHTKADVVKLVESDPTIAPFLRKVRGGYLKIQGTWLPFDTAQTLARRVAWQIRYDLIPLFGPGFPDTCLGPGEPGFGQLLLSAPKPRGRRGAKKVAAAAAANAAAAVAEANRNQASPGSDSQLGNVNSGYLYGSSDLSAGRPQYRAEGLGPITGYNNPSQARYSPYNRVPSHGITQLEPLPSLIQPHQSRASQDNVYQGSYPHSNPRNSLASSTGSIGTLYSGSNLRLSSGSISNSNNALPPMRNLDQTSNSGHFFETYRGPDSFEALSNRWIGTEAGGGCNGVSSDSALLQAESHRSRQLSGSPHMLPTSRDSQAGHPLDQYNYPTSLEHPHSSLHARSSSNPQSQPVERSSSYSFHHSYDHVSGMMGDGVIDRRESSASEYLPPSLYEPSYGGEGTLPPHSERVGSYVSRQSGSPHSHSSHIAPTAVTPHSPSPSSASTSTNLHPSHQRPSHRSSQHTLGSQSQNVNSNQTSSDELTTSQPPSFSVLTSPAHLELNHPSTYHHHHHHPTGNHSESDWNPIKSSVCSPGQTLPN